MNKLFLNGSSGKMGEAIKILLKKNTYFKVLNEDISNAHDCIIDFSRPEATIKLLENCKNKNLSLPIVIGTTGFSDEQLKLIKNEKNYSYYLLVVDRIFCISSKEKKEL